MSVLAAIHQPGSEIPPDEPQEPQASVPRCLALLCLQQTVSSVQAGRAGLWPVPALSQWPALATGSINKEALWQVPGPQLAWEEGSGHSGHCQAVP